jgi:hypothetical protein
MTCSLISREMSVLWSDYGFRVGLGRISVFYST